MNIREIYGIEISFSYVDWECFDDAEIWLDKAEDYVLSFSENKLKRLKLEQFKFEQGVEFEDLSVEYMQFYKALDDIYLDVISGYAEKPTSGHSYEVWFNTGDLNDESLKQN